MNEEERNKLKGLRVEAQSNIGIRTQEQARKFSWRVVELQVSKWWFKDATVITKQRFKSYVYKCRLSGIEPIAINLRLLFSFHREIQDSTK